MEENNTFVIYCNKCYSFVFKIFQITWYIFWKQVLKGSYDDANNIILCNAKFTWFKVKKKTLFFTYIIVALLSPAFLKRDFDRAHHSEKRGVLWLASCPVRCDWPNT